MQPLIEKMAACQLQGRWRQDRADVVQSTVLTLCNPDKVVTWLASPKRTWFCHWVRRCRFSLRDRLDSQRGNASVNGSWAMIPQISQTGSRRGRTGRATSRDHQHHLVEVPPRLAVVFLHEVLVSRSPNFRNCRCRRRSSGDCILSPQEDQKGHSEQVQGSRYLKTWPE